MLLASIPPLLPAIQDVLFNVIYAFLTENDYICIDIRRSFMKKRGRQTLC